MGVRLLLYIAMALALPGCATTQPIHDVIDAPAITRSKAPHRSEVAGAIERAGRHLGWQMTADGPGFFIGRLALRSHVAVVGIEHDRTTYSIRYRDSVNLDAGEGRIHRAYNRWVEKLSAAIRGELELL